MKRLCYGLAIVAASTVLCHQAAAAAALNVRAEGIGSDGYIEPEYAFCIPAAQGHVKPGTDKSVGLYWSEGPAGTKSYAIIGVDTDVPTVFDDAGKEGKTISATLKRKNFYHWVLFDIPAHLHQIPAYTDSQAIVQHGKSVLKTSYGTRGVNDFAPYFASNPDRKGIYAGYDGPCPPWNDALIHHYHFRVFALDVRSLGIAGAVTGEQALDVMKNHILAEGEVIGKYTLNPDVKK